MAFSSFGTLLYHGTALGTYDALPIAEVRDLNGPNPVLGTEDSTHHESPGATDEFVGTTLDPGQLTFEINWDPTAATHSPATGLLSWMAARTSEFWELEYPDGSTDRFKAVVTGFARKAPVKGVLRADVTMKLSGQITTTPFVPGP